MTDPAPKRSLAVFITAAEQRRSDHLHERCGQAYFNALHDWDPDLANEIRGGPLDPFYDDGLLGPMLEFVAERWANAG